MGLAEKRWPSELSVFHRMGWPALRTVSSPEGSGRSVHSHCGTKELLSAIEIKHLPSSANFRPEDFKHFSRRYICEGSKWSAGSAIL
ncbi:hypothetical protein AOLI_G00203710 [Acnodon oligacanthus]